jgi:hypothetical protein
MSLAHTPTVADAADIPWFLPTRGDGLYLGTKVDRPDAAT